MPRCPILSLPGQRLLPPCTAALLAALSLLAPLSAAHGQTPPAVYAQATPAGMRNFPDNAQRGLMQVAPLPELTINGKRLRTTPGFRLFDTQNRLVFAHTLQGQTLTVNYVIEPSTGWLHQVWLLTPEEAQLKLPTQR